MAELIEGKLCSEYHILSNNATTEPRRSHVSRPMMKGRASGLVLAEHRICRGREHCTNSTTLQTSPLQSNFTNTSQASTRDLHPSPTTTSALPSAAFHSPSLPSPPITSSKSPIIYS